MEDIWTVTDRLGRTVPLTAEGLDHINSRRPDMDRWLDFLPLVVAEADLVTQDPRYAHRLRHYKTIVAGRSRIRVVVHY